MGGHRASGPPSAKSVARALPPIATHCSPSRPFPSSSGVVSSHMGARLYGHCCEFRLSPMLRLVSRGEMETCPCRKVTRFVVLSDEEYPRCFECVKPVRGTPSLSPACRWIFVVWMLMQDLRVTEDDTSEDGKMSNPVSEVSATTSQLESLIMDGEIRDMDLSDMGLC